MGLFDRFSPDSLETHRTAIVLTISDTVLTRRLCAFGARFSIVINIIAIIVIITIIIVDHHYHHYCYFVAIIINYCCSVHLYQVWTHAEGHAFRVQDGGSRREWLA
jgi:hypothetical protein